MVNLILLNLLTAAAIEHNIGLEQAETILLETRVHDMASGLSKTNNWSLIKGDQDEGKSPPKVGIHGIATLLSTFCNSALIILFFRFASDTTGMKIKG